MLQILENSSLQNFNTFGIDAYARFFVEINHQDDLVELFSDPQWKRMPYLVIGGGSNLLFTQNFEGLIIKMNIRGIEHRINHEQVMVEAGAGEVWHDLVKYCVNRGFCGIENLSLIPGSVGASPIQNIGAYGIEIKDVFHSCTAFEIESLQFKTFYHQDCEFGYRESVFKGKLKGKYIISSVKYQLSTQQRLKLDYGAIKDELSSRGIAHPSIKDVSEVVSAIRVAKLPDPSTIGNAGSFFKNPVISTAEFQKVQQQFPEMVHFIVPDGIKLAAGWLIEQCGWKGKVVGHTGTWKNQALVLVNHGNATGSEIFELSQQIIQSVKSKFGIELEREVNLI
ncbi:MAG: UDP-N-acetylmuramate dehydrogenase [Sphingobacteriales bacterium]|nr:UDP-N-acetylmuramate dehydrogenase [Sphingobacteriales bacterium]